MPMDLFGTWIDVDTASKFALMGGPLYSELEVKIMDLEFSHIQFWESFLQSFFPLLWFKKGSCQLLANLAQTLTNCLED